MKKLILSALIVAPVAFGCGSKKPASTASTTPPPSLTNVDAPPPPVAEPLQRKPDVVVVADAPSRTQAPTGALGRGTYTVKKGDTLWSIAQRTYGNGNQYKKILSANPSIKGEAVKVGQVITLP